MRLAAALGYLRVIALTACQPDWRMNARWLKRGFASDAGGLERMQLERLSRLLAHFRKLGFGDLYRDSGQLRHYRDLTVLPVIRRADMQDLRPRLDEIHRGRRVFEERSSGTSGVPVGILVDARWRRANECQKHELQKLCGAAASMPQVCLWSNPAGIGLPALPRGSFSWLFFQREMFNAYVPDDETYRRLHEAVLRWPGTLLVGYAGALGDCAHRLAELGLCVPAGHVSACWTGSEVLSEARRAAIRTAFGVEPRAMYGSHECHWMAMECSQGTMHISPRHIVEATDPDSGEILPEGQSGELLVSDLGNDITPVIRYAIGDYGSVGPSACACGRGGQAIGSLEGRSAELIRLPSGRRVHSLAISRVMRLQPQVRQWQLVRLARQKFRVDVQSVSLDAQAVAEMQRILQGVLEGAELEFRLVDSIAKTASGKYSYYREEWQDKLHLAGEPGQ